MRYIIRRSRRNTQRSRSIEMFSRVSLSHCKPSRAGASSTRVACGVVSPPNSEDGESFPHCVPMRAGPQNIQVFMVSATGAIMKCNRLPDVSADIMADNHICQK